MAINCYWKEKVGTLKHGENTLHLYGGGNVYACICFDEIDKDGDTIHHLNDFIVDWKHLKEILNDALNHYSGYSEIRLNTKYSETLKIAGLLTKAGKEVTLYFDNNKGEKI